MSTADCWQRTGSRSRRRWETSDGGATAVEYALMVSLIAVVIVAAVTLLGSNLTDLFNNAAELL